MALRQIESFSWDRMFSGMDKVRERLRRTSAALKAAGVPFAVVGGNAVAAWVATMDESMVRNTRDVDLLLPRSSFDQAKAALESAGFTYRHVKGIDMFLDGRETKAGDAVRVLFSDEIVREGDVAPTPGIHESVRMHDMPTIELEALVRMKLTSYRRKDQVHLLDMIAVGLIDESWIARFTGELAARLQHIFDTPEG